MGKRRMFSPDVVGTDHFLEMPSSTQLLYFHLGMEADDDGFLASPKKVITYTNGAADDLKLLITKGYVIPFESGVIVIRHWKINNLIKGDRYKETMCKTEKSLLKVDDSNIYYLPELIWNPDGTQTEPQVRLGKVRLDKENNNAQNGIECDSCGEALEVKTASAGEKLPTTRDLSEDFNEFWKAYPKKVAKKDAEKAFKGLKPSKSTLQDIISSINRWKKSRQWKIEKGQYIPYPATFLRKEHWKDKAPDLPEGSDADEYNINC